MVKINFSPPISIKFHSKQTISIGVYEIVTECSVSFVLVFPSFIVGVRSFKEFKTKLKSIICSDQWISFVFTPNVFQSSSNFNMNYLLTISGSPFEIGSV